MRSAVLLLDDDELLLNTMAEVIRSFCDRPVVAAKSFNDLIARGDTALQCGVALLDINLGMDVPSGIDAYFWLKEQGFRGQIFFFTGHAKRSPLAIKAHDLGAAGVLDKPISVDSLRHILGMYP